MSRTNKTTQAVIETLETRTLMSAALGISQVAFEGGTQLRITGTTGNNQITVKQTAAGLVVANGTWNKTVAGMFNSLWINGEAGNNSIIIDPSVTIDATVFGGGVNDSIVAGSGNETLYGGTGKNVIKAGNGNDTLVSIGSTSDTLVGGAGMDSFWTDNSSAEKIQNVTAAENNSGAVHRVGGYINAPVTAASKKAKTVAATTAITEPAVDAGVTYANFSNDPIFASGGPTADDIFQGNVGDCYFLSVLASTAKVDAARIQNSVLDMGDGTVIVQLDKNGKAVYVHEDESLPVNSDGTLAYAGLGAQNCTWVGLMEKAWTYVRTNTASYDAINAGWMDEAYSALGAVKVTSTFTASSAASLLTLIQKDLAAGQGVTYATQSAPDGSGLIEDHAYTVIAAGTNSLTLRNPWGVDADGTGNGYVTITGAQALAAFTGMVAANV